MNAHKVEKSDTVGLLSGMIITILLASRISGSHFNPCITLGFMIGNVRHRRFDRVLGCLYMLAQVVGAFLGNLFCKIFVNGVEKIDLKVELTFDAIAL